MNPLSLSLLALIFASSAFADTEDPHTYVPDFGCIGGPNGLRIQEDYKALISLGKLKGERVLHVTDWDSYKTETRELLFDGLRIVVITFTNDKTKIMIETVEITNPIWDLAGGIRVGEPINTVMRRFGLEKHGNHNEISFSGDTDYVRFAIKQGRITKIKYECYTG